MTPKEILVGVRDLLADRSHWTQGTCARKSKGGKAVTYNSPEASCWCLIGAIEKVASGDGGVANAINLIYTCLPPMPARDLFENRLVRFNDNKNRKHAQVIRVLECAIEKAEY